MIRKFQIPLHKGILVGLTLLAFFLLVGIFAPWIAPHDPLAVHLTHRLSRPSMSYPFGTDHLGRCIFSRILYGVRISVTTAIIVMIITLIISVPISLIAGYIRGKLDTFMMRILDSILSIPDIVLTVAIVGLLGPGLFNMIFAIIAVRWATYVRFIRSLVIKVSKEDYIISARISGNRHSRILRRYILPQIMMPVLTFSTFDIGKIVLTISALSFLGLGSQPPTPEWGAMLNDATAYFQAAPHTIFFPGLAIVLFVFTCQLLGNQLEKTHQLTHKGE